MGGGRILSRDERRHTIHVKVHSSSTLLLRFHGCLLIIYLHQYWLESVSGKVSSCRSQRKLSPPSFPRLYHQANCGYPTTQSIPSHYLFPPKKEDSVDGGKICFLRRRTAPGMSLSICRPQHKCSCSLGLLSLLQYAISQVPNA